MLEAALEQMDDIITGKSFWFIIVLSRLPTLRLWGLKGNSKKEKMLQMPDFFLSFF